MSKKGKATFSEAPNSLIHLAEAIIHQHHRILEDARIAFVMRSEPQKRGSRMIMGNTSKVPEKMQPYLEFDFLIWIAESTWNDLSDAQREALIDHELCHCKRSTDGLGWSLREHDLQEFSIVIERHGLWDTDLRRMDQALATYRQERFPLRNAEITVSGAGKVATLTGEQFDRIAGAINDSASAD